MTTELEQEFYDTFGIEPKIDYDYKTIIQNVTKTGYWFDKEYLIKMFNDNQKFKVIQVRKNINYPDITAEKLLKMTCIWNYIMPCIDDCIIPIDYLGLKSVVLDKMIRYSEIEYEFDVDALKYQIQQLFKD